jgi:hypothetical protein
VKFGEARDVEQIAGRIDRTGGDPELAIYVRSMAKINSGDYSTGLRQLLAYRRNKLHGSGGLANDGLGDGLMRLGYYGEVAKLWNREAWWAPAARRGNPRLTVADGVKVGPRDYWLASYFPDLRQPGGDCLDIPRCWSTDIVGFDRATISLPR